MDRLVDPLREMEENSIDYVEKPALREFKLVIREPIPSVYMNVIRFKKTILPHSPVRVPIGDGIYMETTPYIDAFMSFRNRTEVDSVMTIFTFRIFDENGKERITGTMQKEYWRNHNQPMNAYIEDDYMRFVEVMRDFKLVYIGIQKAMYDKPVVFSVASEREVSSPAAASKKSKKRNRAKIVKTIQFNGDELKKYAEPHKHMTCPCWGVIGHWRNYKSGKRVWIEPYRKGKMRNQPEAYQPKDYVFMKEDRP